MISRNFLWSAPPESLSLLDDEVHVWRSGLDRPPSYVEMLLHTLAADEVGKAERFYFQNNRDHFIVARGILRAILSRYLNGEPNQFRFCYNEYGKPALIKEMGGDSIRFNISYSHGLALFAIARGREVGVDIELIRAGLACEQIAENFFSAKEINAIRGLPDNLQVEAFFNCWTRKEAYIKANGKGLSMPLDQFQVSVVPGQPAALLSTKDKSQEASRWSLSELSPAHGFVAAIAVEGKDWQLKCWQWPE